MPRPEQGASPEQHSRKGSKTSEPQMEGRGPTRPASTEQIYVKGESRKTASLAKITEDRESLQTALADKLAKIKEKARLQHVPFSVPLDQSVMNISSWLEERVVHSNFSRTGTVDISLVRIQAQRNVFNHLLFDGEYPEGELPHSREEVNRMRIYLMDKEGEIRVARQDAQSERGLPETMFSSFYDDLVTVSRNLGTLEAYAYLQGEDTPSAQEYAEGDTARSQSEWKL